MSSTRVFVARLAGTPVFDPAGDPVGRVRDVVAVLRPAPLPPRAIGLVVEIPGRRRVFLAMTRVTSIDPGQVISTGLLNVRRFQRRATETLTIAEVLDRQVTVRATGDLATVYDVGMEQTRTRDWELRRVAVLIGGRRFGRRRESAVLDWDEVTGATKAGPGQPATRLLATLEDMRPADLARTLRDLTPVRRTEVAGALDDPRLAEVLAELPKTEQVEILGTLDPERAADVVDVMSPDDAADLVAGLPTERAEQLLGRMEPKEAEDVRRLMTYDEETAGGLMTSEPIVLPPDAKVADALARARIPEVTPALAAMVYVCRAPHETPTGTYLGVTHVQRLLREPPSTLVSAVLDSELEPLHPDASLEQVAAFLARYNLVAAPVIDDTGHLLGAVTVDDVLDHLLPAGWREHLPEGPEGTRRPETRREESQP